MTTTNPYTGKQEPLRRRPSRSGVRFEISNRGSRRVIEHRNQREYENLLREMPHWNAELQVRQDEDGDWVIAAKLPSELTHGQHEIEETQLGEGQYWDNKSEAQAYLTEHEDDLRLELTESLFTMGICTRCDAVVPVFGNYVQYSPAGMLVCGPCLSDDDNCEPSGPAILHA